jgi:polyhydroxybutyrate depolymerase
MRQFFMSAFLISLLVVSLSVTAQENDATTRLEIEHDGDTYEVRVYVPSSYDGSTEVQLMLAFHPGFSSAEAMQRLTDFDRLAEESGVIVAYPDSIVGYWDYGVSLPEWDTVRDVRDHLGYAEKVYEMLLEEYAISEVYLAGFSNGSRMVMRLACEHVDWFSGAGVVAAGISSEVVAACPEDASLPIYYEHGTDDTVVPFEGKPLTDGGQVISYALPATDMTTFWALQNECELEPDVSNLDDPNPDDAVSVREILFDDCATGNPVLFYAMLGGSHGWSGAVTLLQVEDYVPSHNTSEAMWTFFGLNR